jgi:hypothetical protein
MDSDRRRQALGTLGRPGNDSQVEFVLFASKPLGEHGRDLLCAAAAEMRDEQQYPGEPIHGLWRNPQV